MHLCYKNVYEDGKKKVKSLMLVMRKYFSHYSVFKSSTPLAVNSLP